MGKRIVVCCDGTWNRPDETDAGLPAPTNVTKLALCVLARGPEGTEQQVFYETGVGTGRWDRITGGWFGAGLSQKIKNAYRFVVTSYEPGDELFFFGFSRGAYTARSTVGVIRNCGILKREHIDRLDAAYALYRRRDPASHPRELEAQLFRRTYSWQTRIAFIGVWDTVGALGIPGTVGPLLNWRNRFHDVTLSASVDHAYQALAVDETRRFFEPTLWEQQPDARGQVLEQVWFAGSHGNVGGGYRDARLSDIALLWIVDKAERCGLAFDRERLASLVHPDPLGELRDSMTPLYRPFGRHVRPIGRARGGVERIASSAITRRTKDSEYRPANLESFLQRGGEVEAVAERLSLS